MREVLKVQIEQPLIGLASDIVYAQAPLWCNATCQQLHLSLMRPRRYYDYDPKTECPLLVFVCGGGFEQMDRNVWMGELAWFAKRGYAVACVEYSTLPRTKWPAQICNIKQAIRFLRAHAEQFGILPDRVVVMGESAGGYLALLAGLTGDAPEYKTGANAAVSDAVQAVVSWYPVTDLPGMNKGANTIRMDLTGAPNLRELITGSCPPVMLLHGTADQLVPASESEAMYEALCKKQVPAELYILEGAHHNDVPFVQECMKQKMLEFIEKALAR